jgi:hypothetical protein
MTMAYESDTLLSECIADFFEQSKNDLCELSREPDKSVLIIDELRRQIITWLAYHQTGE